MGGVVVLVVVGVTSLSGNQAKGSVNFGQTFRTVNPDMFMLCIFVDKEKLARIESLCVGNFF